MPTDGFIYFLSSDRIVIFWGLGTQVAYGSEIRTWLRLFDNAPTHEVSSSYV